jgi:hypothetical protein
MDSLTEAKIKGKVTIGNKAFFAVVSRSRPGEWHLSRRDQCSCKAGFFGHHCHHRNLCICVRCLGDGYVEGDPTEGCYFCGGTGDAR